MPLDALCLSGLVHELNGALSGARIDKIYQPGRDEVVLALRAPGGNVKLLLSANPNHPRPQLTQLPRENPGRAPHVLHAAAQASVGRPHPVHRSAPPGAGGGDPPGSAGRAGRAGGSTDARLDAMGQEGRRAAVGTGWRGLLKDVQENRFTP